MQKEIKYCCCDCTHFRMFKPKEMYCTVKKTQVDPLKKICSEEEIRKNLKVINL